MITKEQIDASFAGTNFGSDDRVFLICDAIAKSAEGYGNGWTITQICRELGVLTQKSTVTLKGLQFIADNHETFNRIERIKS